jgi:hypothetical protein
MPLGALRLRSRPANLPFSKPLNDAAPIAFMHIPKTSGTALTAGLREAIKPRREVNGFDRVLFGEFQSFPTFVEDERRRIYTDPTNLPRDTDFIAGHIAYSTLWRRYGPINYLTVLREPISRILSLWLYWRAIPDDPLARVGAWADYVRRAREPLKDFLSSKDTACQTDNLSVRMLLWPHRLIPEGDFIDGRHDASLLKDALGALKQFSFVDIIENPGMPANLECWLSRRVPYARINRTPHLPPPLAHPLHEELTSIALDLIEERTRLDLKLWTLVAGQRVTAQSPDMFRYRIILRSAARHAALMTATATG